MAKLQILRSSLHLGLQAKVTAELNGDLVHDPTGNPVCILSSPSKYSIFSPLEGYYSITQWDKRPSLELPWARKSLDWGSCQKSWKQSWLHTLNLLGGDR